MLTNLFRHGALNNRLKTLFLWLSGALIIAVWQSAAVAREFVGSVDQHRVPVIGKDCFVYYPFSPVPPNLTVSYSGNCENREKLADTAIREKDYDLVFFSNNIEDSRVVGINFHFEIGDVCGDNEASYFKSEERFWTFSDGEVWQAKSCRWRLVKDTLQNQKKKESDAIAQRKIENARLKLENARLEKFRKNVSPGDNVSTGIVVEVKGNLIKIQTNDSQCSQRNYEGNCTNYINTPAEKWFKRSEVYPR